MSHKLWCQLGVRSCSGYGGGRQGEWLSARHLLCAQVLPGHTSSPGTCSAARGQGQATTRAAQDTPSGDPPGSRTQPSSAWAAPTRMVAEPLPQAPHPPTQGLLTLLPITVALVGNGILEAVVKLGICRWTSWIRVGPGSNPCLLRRGLWAALRRPWRSRSGSLCAPHRGEASVNTCQVSGGPLPSRGGANTPDDRDDTPGSCTGEVAS